MPNSSKPHVLLVDDDVDACDLYEAALKPYGFDVSMSYDVPTALAQLRAETFDVAVVDVGLGSVGGLDLVRRVTAELGDRAPYFIAVSGYSRPQDRAVGIDAGFREYHAKPFAPMDLVAAIQRRIEATRSP